MTAQSGNSGGNSMQQRMRDVSVLEQKRKTFIMCAGMLAVVPVFCALAVAPGVSALSLPNIVKDVTASVIDILPGKGVSGQPASSPASEHSSKHQAAPATPSTAGTTTSTPQPVAYGAPLEPMPILSQDLQPMNTLPSRNAQPVVASSLHTVQGSSFAFLQPSERGWEIFGVPWYLWALAVAAIAGIWWWITTVRRRRQSS